MKVYADARPVRVRQVLSDAGALVWTALWITLGLWIHDLVQGLSGPARRVEGAGRGVAREFLTLAERVGGIPVVGERLREPMLRVARAGRAMEHAGATLEGDIQILAFWLGLLLAAIPIAYVLLTYVPGRVHWAREATAADGLLSDGADLKVFALRALANRPLHELRKAAPDPAGAFDSGNYRALAAVELRALGLRPPGP